MDALCTIIIIVDCLKQSYLICVLHLALWEDPRPNIYVDITLTYVTFLCVVLDYVHPLTETVFPNGCGVFQQDDVSQNGSGIVWGA